MLPSDKDLQRAASRLVDALVEKRLLQPGDNPTALQKRVFTALQKNFREEAEIDREAERILSENRKLSTGMDQRTLLTKIRQKIARDRGFVL